MPRVAKPAPDRIPSPTFSSGYLKQQGRQVWFYYKTVKQASGIRWEAIADDPRLDPETRREITARRQKALAELDDWIDAIRNPKPAIAEPEPAPLPPRRLHEVARRADESWQAWHRREHVQHLPR
jgi:hypothetical protein